MEVGNRLFLNALLNREDIKYKMNGEGISVLVEVAVVLTQMTDLIC